MNQVKWKDKDGNIKYGTVQYMSRLSKEERPPKGIIRVNDAVMPFYHEVPEKDLIEIPYKSGRYDHDKNKWVDQDEYHQFISDQFEKAQELSDSLGDEFKPGKMFNTPVGDGRAYYVVTKVNKKSVKVEWRGFCPDNWKDQVLGLGGSFPRDTIETLVKRHDGLKKLFSGARI